MRLLKEDQEKLEQLVMESLGSIDEQDEHQALDFIRSNILPKKVNEWNNLIKVYNKDRLSRRSRIWINKTPTSLSDALQNLVKMGSNKYMVDLRPDSMVVEFTIFTDISGKVGVSVSNFGETSNKSYKVPE